MRTLASLTRFGAVAMLLAVSAHGSTLTAITTIGPLGTGFDPFFWSGAPLATSGIVPTGSSPVTCGLNCSSFSAVSTNLLINNSQLYAVTNPAVTIFANPAGDGLVSLTGLINVSTYTVAYALNLYVGAGTLDPADLTTDPVFSATPIDTTNSNFQYQIVAGGPPLSGTFSLNGGIVEAVADSVPEPASMALMSIGVAGIGLIRRKIRL